MVSLPDVSVLIAVLDPRHEQHSVATDWFEGARRDGWATCPLTLNGCARVLGNPNYLDGPGSIEGALIGLRLLCLDQNHQFWPDEISLIDESIFEASKITGPSQVTDTYLLALAVRHNGQLATLDRRIRLDAVIGAEQRHLHVLT